MPFLQLHLLCVADEGRPCCRSHAVVGDGAGAKNTFM